MQNAKDSFYIALRNRLAVVNPARVMTLRAVERPGILVEEAEAEMAEMPSDVFSLRWVGTDRVEGVPGAMWRAGCEVRYATAGSQGHAGLDRGRALTAMDAELLHMLEPLSTPKLNYTTTPATAMQTNVFWGLPVAGTTETLRDRLLRMVMVTVFAFNEPGER